MTTARPQAIGRPLGNSTTSLETAWVALIAALTTFGLLAVRLAQLGLFRAWTVAAAIAIACTSGWGARLNLDFTPPVHAAVREYSDASNPAEVPMEQPYALKRDRRAVTRNWKQRLSQAQTDHIRLQSEDIAGEYDSDDDW